MKELILKKIIILFLLSIIIFIFFKQPVLNFNNNNKKIAICFWGLCRSTNFVLDSINENIFIPLNEMNIDYDIYMHTYKLFEKSYDYSGNLLDINNDNWKLLNPDYVIIDNQSKIDDIIDINNYNKYKNSWEDKKDNHKIVHNFIRALYSLKQVTSLWQNRKNNYDYIMYIRPDVLYLNKLTPDFFDINNNQIILQNTNKFPISDRFGIGKPDTMLIFGNRYDEINEYIKNNNIHSETFLNYILNKNNIEIKELTFDFKLVRSNGDVVN